MFRNVGGVDVELGLYAYGARYYDPSVGRFLTIDPLVDHAPGWTSYHYTFNNPVNYIDPDGRWPITPIGFGTIGSKFSQSVKDVTLAIGRGVGGLIEAGLNLAQSGHLARAARRNGNHEAAQGFIDQGKYAAGIITFEALQGFVAGKVFKGASALFTTASGSSKSIALGIKNRGLSDFATSKGSSMMDNWLDEGLISAGHETFDTAFKEATENVISSGGKIHFNLDGFDIGKAMGNRGKGLYDDGVGYTDWEFGQILDNPQFLDNTIFYNKSGKIDIDAIINMVKSN